MICKGRCVYDLRLRHSVYSLCQPLFCLVCHLIATYRHQIADFAPLWISPHRFSHYHILVRAVTPERVKVIILKSTTDCLVKIITLDINPYLSSEFSVVNTKISIWAPRFFQLLLWQFWVRVRKCKGQCVVHMIMSMSTCLCMCLMSESCIYASWFWRQEAQSMSVALPQDVSSIVRENTQLKVWHKC